MTLRNICNALGTVGGVLILGMTITLASAQSGGGNWPQYRFDNVHDGVNPAETVLSTAAVPHLQLKWSFTTGGIVSGSPAVADGVVYVPSGDGYVYALDAATGNRKWRSANITAGTSTPVVQNGRVFIGTGVDSGSVYALDASTGRTIWNTATGGVTSSPAVANGVVYVGTNSHTIVALEATNGSDPVELHDGQFIDCIAGRSHRDRL